VTSCIGVSRYDSFPKTANKKTDSLIALSLSRRRTHVYTPIHFNVTDFFAVHVAALSSEKRAHVNVAWTPMRMRATADDVSTIDTCTVACLSFDSKYYLTSLFFIKLASPSRVFVIFDPLILLSSYSHLSKAQLRNKDRKCPTTKRKSSIHFFFISKYLEIGGECYQLVFDFESCCQQFEPCTIVVI
jgi:hypothetical protein